MEKPFDVNDLVAKLKEKGMPVAEEMVVAVEVALFQWIEESVKLSPSQVDDFAIPILKALKPLIDAQIAKIDGK